MAQEHEFRAQEWALTDAANRGGHALFGVAVQVRLRPVALRAHDDRPGGCGGAVGGAVNGSLGGSVNGAGSLGGTLGSVGNVGGALNGVLTGPTSIANSVSASELSVRRCGVA